MEERSESGRTIPRNVVVLGLVSLFTDAASEMIYPLIPVFIALLGSGPLLLGVLEGIAESTAALLKLVTGILSDRMKRRKGFVLAGYALSSFARPLTGLVIHPWQIVPVRMADRVGKGVRSSPRDALIAASVDESIRGRAFGFHRAMDHLGAVLGPLLALGALYFSFSVLSLSSPEEALRVTFLLSLVPGMLAVGTVLFFVQEDGKQKESPAVSTGIPRRLPLSFAGFSPQLLRYIAIVLLFTLGNSTDAFLLFRIAESSGIRDSLLEMGQSSGFLMPLLESLTTNGNSPPLPALWMLPLLWSLFHIIKVLFSTPLGILSDALGRRKVIVWGWSIYAFVYFSFALLEEIPSGMQPGAVVGLMGIYALYYAFTEGTEKAFVADLAQEEKRGSAFGLYHFAVGMGALPSSILFGLVYQSFGGRVAFSAGGVIALLSMALLLLFVKERENTKRP